MKPTILEVGSKFGQWTTTSLKYKIEKSHHYVVDVVCDCGTESTVYAAQLTGGRTARCKKCGAGSRPRVNEHDYVINAVFGWYKKSAKKRGIVFDLAKKDFGNLLFSPCHYCGSEPKNSMRDRFCDRILPKYGGIDRVDNSLGYQLSNIVPACRWCNEAKKAKSEQEFDSWIEGLIENYSMRNGSQAERL